MKNLDNNSKGFLPVIAVVVGVFVLGGGVAAVASDSARPGDILYGLDRSLESVRGALVFGEINEANYNAELATERLEELQSLISDGATSEAMEKAQQNYEEFLDRALEYAERARSNGEDSEEVMGIIAENALRQSTALTEAYEQAADEAKRAIERAREASMRGFETATEKLSQERMNELREMMRSEIPDIDYLMSDEARESLPNETRERIEQEVRSRNLPEGASGFEGMEMPNRP